MFKKMKAIFITLITISFSTCLIAQHWESHIYEQRDLIDDIVMELSWDNIFYNAKKNLQIDDTYTSDISSTLNFIQSDPINKIDTFFHLICNTAFSNFPYRKSGRLEKTLYQSENHLVIEAKENDSKLSKLIAPPPPPTPPSLGFKKYKSLYPYIRELTSLDSNKSIPLLFNYLRNDAATRLVIKPWDEELNYYLSISDVAMEMLEIITLCDFFDNASQSNKLFSNLEEKEKDEIIFKIEKWIKFSKGVSKSKGIEYFLDSICEVGHSYRFTCNNLLFSGYTKEAKEMYTKFYMQTEMPCRLDFETGKILLKLGDTRMLYDCSDKIYNYKCTPDGWESLGSNCVEILFNSEEAWFRDDVFAEIIATEPNSNYRKKNRKTFIWHYIFGMIPNNTERKLLKSLIEFMKIQDGLSTLNNRFTKDWKSQYPKEFESNYRVCDFAMIKYIETIEEIEKDNLW